MVPRLMMRRAEKNTVTVVRSLVQVVLLSSSMQTLCQSCPQEVFVLARIEGAVGATPPPACDSSMELVGASIEVTSGGSERTVGAKSVVSSAGD